MGKILWKPGNMLYPAPAVLVSCGGTPGNRNIITVAWTGNVCTDPAMTYISLKPGRYSHSIIGQSNEFVINLTTPAMIRAVDLCGVVSGKGTDKFKRCSLTPGKCRYIKAPLISESPVSLECRVSEIKHLGSHDMFLARVLCIHADRRYIDPKGALDLEACGLIVFAHGKYYSLGKYLGYFGFSISKKKRGGSV
ncbi:MAG: flavin reductase family protein [bacterium]|nr:flavin reductase family protein [bacterium]